MKNTLPQKDQSIALCADNLHDAGLLLPFVNTLAASLRKNIILFSTSPHADSWIETPGLPFAALKTDWPSAIEAMPTAFNVILAVALVDPSAPRQSPTHPKQRLLHFHQSKTAYILLPSAAATLSPPASPRVALTLDHQRESKEKLLWASYFARFCHSTITLLHHPYTDQAFRSRLENNFRYAEKIFSSLNLSYNRQPLPHGNQFVNPDLKAVTLPGIDLFISLVPDQRDRDLLDLLSTPLPRRLIHLAPATPILFLNQRDDLYILCD